MHGKTELQNCVSENEDFLQLKGIREHWKMIAMRIAWYIYKNKIYNSKVKHFNLYQGCTIYFSI